MYSLRVPIIPDSSRIIFILHCDPEDHDSLYGNRFNQLLYLAFFTLHCDPEDHSSLYEKDTKSRYFTINSLIILNKQKYEGIMGTCTRYVSP